MELNDILSFIGQIVLYGGGSAVVAYSIFALLGKNLIERWFLKSFKHYEYQINALLNRVTKIHEKEFEVLPKAWEKLQDALGQVNHLASPIQYYPDFIRMSEREFREFIEYTKLKKHEVEELARLSPADRNNYYMDRIFWYELHEVKSRINDLHNYLVYNKIFLSKDLFEEFGKLDRMLRESAAGIESDHRYKENKSTTQGWERLKTDSQEIADRIEILVQGRLHYPEAK